MMDGCEPLLPNEAEAAEYARAAAHRLGRLFVVGAFALAVLCGALSAGALAPFSRAGGARGDGASSATLVEAGGVDDYGWPGGVDDSMHVHCSEYVQDSRITPANCKHTDDSFCEYKLETCGGDFATNCPYITSANCSCDGSFGLCLMTAVSRIENICEHTAGLAGRAPEAMAVRRAARSLLEAASADAAAAALATPTPTPAPSDFVFYEFPDCACRASRARRRASRARRATPPRAHRASPFAPRRRHFRLLQILRAQRHLR